MYSLFSNLPTFRACLMSTSRRATTSSLSTSLYLLSLHSFHIFINDFQIYQLIKLLLLWHGEFQNPEWMWQKVLVIGVYVENPCNILELQSTKQALRTNYLSLFCWILLKHFVARNLNFFNQVLKVSKIKNKQNSWPKPIM